MSINTLCNPDPLKSGRSQTPTPSSFDEGSLRPRRMAASATRSYRIPTDSDEDEMSDDIDHSYSMPKRGKAKGKGKARAVERMPNVQPESIDLHLWTKHLGLLLKEEEKKVCHYLILLERFSSIVMCLRSGKNENASQRKTSLGGPGNEFSRYLSCTQSPISSDRFNDLDRIHARPGEQVGCFKGT
jgi:hypothetical protein